MGSKSQPEERRNHVLVRCCLALVLQRNKNAQKPDADSNENDPGVQAADGFTVFSDFVQQNVVCFWNSCLVKSVASLEFRGCLLPVTVLMEGTEFALEVIRSAWARRVLRPPKGYAIVRLGDLSAIEMRTVPQTQFAPLSEALCKVVVELNSNKVPATADAVSSRLEENFPEMEVPSQKILYRTLGGLIRERKLYHTGEGYYVVSPDTYRQRALSPLCERQMLMTNEEAIVRLHGNRKERSLATQVDEVDIAAAVQYSESLNPSSCIAATEILPHDCRLERSHSFRLLRVERQDDLLNRCGSFFKEPSKKNGLVSGNIGDFDSQDMQKCEKQSMLTKLLKRMQSFTDKPHKQVTFSAQFPPQEWVDTVSLHCHSVATQTQVEVHKLYPNLNDRYSFHGESVVQKIPWEESDPSDNKLSPESLENSNLRLRRSTDLENSNTSRRKGLSLPREDFSKISNTHNFSHRKLSGHIKRHRHRRSSSESPKAEKSKKTENSSLDTDYKTPTDRKIEESRIHRSTILEPNAISNPKAVIGPCSVTYKKPHTPTLSLKSASPEIPMDSAHRCFSLPFPNPTQDDAIYLPKNNTLVSETNNVFHSTPNSITKPFCFNFGKDDRRTASENSTLQPSSNESSSETSTPCNGWPKLGQVVHPLTTNEPCTSTARDVSSKQPKRKSAQKEVVIDNSVVVEMALEKIPRKPNEQSPSSKHASTTVCQTVTEETTVTKGSGNSKIVTVTNITTSLSRNSIKEIDRNVSNTNSSSPDAENVKDSCYENYLNREAKNAPGIIDCSSTCNIITEIK